jgi:hypothetical protein
LLLLVIILALLEDGRQQAGRRNVVRLIGN